MMLSITIPAYNEEQAIREIIERCEAARASLLSGTDLTEVEVIVVSDGSTDRTVEVAREFADEGRIRLIEFESNRGYGAALKRGFHDSRGDLVSFIDADGTCDPEYFVPLVNACLRDGADVACGNRMTSQSKMPTVRWLGNLIFRSIVNFLARSAIRDVASGMRVIRAAKLPALYPLPDGLNFTPAMTCRAALDSTLELAEIDMVYEERIGRSKLSVVGDGLRFLGVILDVALTYRPLRLFMPVAALLLALAGSLGGTIAWAKFVEPGYPHLPKWYFFRMMTALVAGGAALTLVTLGLVAQRVTFVVRRTEPEGGLAARLLLRFVQHWSCPLLGVLLVVFGVALNGGTARDWVSTGRISLDTWWTYVITGAFLAIVGVQTVGLAVVDRTLRLLRAAVEPTSASNG